MELLLSVWKWLLTPVDGRVFPHKKRAYRMGWAGCVLLLLLANGGLLWMGPWLGWSWTVVGMGFQLALAAFVAMYHGFGWEF